MTPIGKSLLLAADLAIRAYVSPESFALRDPRFIYTCHPVEYTSGSDVQINRPVILSSNKICVCGLGGRYGNVGLTVSHIESPSPGSTKFMATKVLDVDAENHRCQPMLFLGNIE